MSYHAPGAGVKGRAHDRETVPRAGQDVAPRSFFALRLLRRSRSGDSARSRERQRPDWPLEVAGRRREAQVSRGLAGLDALLSVPILKRGNNVATGRSGTGCTRPNRLRRKSLCRRADRTQPEPTGSRARDHNPRVGGSSPSSGISNPLYLSGFRRPRPHPRSLPVHRRCVE
jgi:hypothetical protein